MSVTSVLSLVVSLSDPCISPRSLALFRWIYTRAQSGPLSQLSLILWEPIPQPYWFCFSFKMIITILLSCLTIRVSAVPVSMLSCWLYFYYLFLDFSHFDVYLLYFLFFQTPSSVLPSALSQGGATQATSQKPEAQTPALLYPEVEPPQSGVKQPEAGPPFLPLPQHYTWYPQGGGPMIIPVHMSQPANLPVPPQQPLVRRDDRRHLERLMLWKRQKVNELI